MKDFVITLWGFSLVVPADAQQLFLAACVGLIIGIDRALRGKPASLRTFSMIATGSCLFALVSVSAGAFSPHIDGSRIAAQIVSGVGFLGGGVIFKTADRVEGITTAAMIWLTAALGMACGFNEIEVVYWSFAIAVFAHFVSRIGHKIIDALLRRETEPEPEAA